ncbi:MAG: VTT domain-containing protein [Candidatus Bipolaricaulota bacterium]|nr:VTT domain-containing protein [Candidatus Bipolaricaulota bacterium]MDW8126191.1 VTT domain-containing protein [Candidatus Bipolaricaulota bacterium]
MAFALFLVFLYAAGTVIALPTPQELVLGAVATAPGWAVITVAAAGRALGAYLLFFLGAKVKSWQKLRAWREKDKRIQRWVIRTERWVNRLGAPALFFLLLIPGFPDTVVTYVLAMFNRRPWAFALAMASASALRLSLAYLGIFYIVNRG